MSYAYMNTPVSQHVNMAIIPHSYYSIHFLAYCHAPQNAWRDFIFKNRQVFKVCLARLSAIKMLHKRQQQNLHPHYLCPFKYAHDVASTFWMRYWWQAMLEFNCTFIKLPLISAKYDIMHFSFEFGISNIIWLIKSYLIWKQLFCHPTFLLQICYKLGFVIFNE